MGFFSGYKGGSMGLSAVLGGLGKLTMGTTARAKPAAAKVVAAFVRGEHDNGVCSRKSGSCEIYSDGQTLRVGTYKLAERPSPVAREVRVCIPARGDFITTADGKRVQAQSSKDVRAAAAALLQTLRAGIGVKDGSGGERLLSGRGGNARVMVPGECLNVRITPAMADAAAEMIEAHEMAPDKSKRGVRKQLTENRKVKKQAKAAARSARAREQAAARKAKKAADAAAEAAKREERNRKARERRAAARAAASTP